MIDLVILDLYGTIWASRKPPRKGLLNFFDHYKDKKFVVATDEPDTKIAKQLLADLKLLNWIEKIYVSRDMKTAKDACHGERKDLKQICADFDVPPGRAVFISDGDRDRMAAQRDGVPFVHVPYYERANEAFSFALIELSKKLPMYCDLRNVNQ